MPEGASDVFLGILIKRTIFQAPPAKEASTPRVTWQARQGWGPTFAPIGMMRFQMVAVSKHSDQPGITVAGLRR